MKTTALDDMHETECVKEMIVLAFEGLEVRGTLFLFIRLEVIVLNFPLLQYFFLTDSKQH